MTTSDWQPISTVLCDDQFVMLRWSDGIEAVNDMDHDSDPDYWAARGATHWRKATEDELDAFFGAWEV
jgi:hypothetical protein